MIRGFIIELSVNSHKSAISVTSLPIDNFFIKVHSVVLRLIKWTFNLGPAVPKIH